MCCVGMYIFVNLIQELNKSNGQAMGKSEGNGDEAKDFIKGWRLNQKLDRISDERIGLQVIKKNILEL